MKNQILKSLMLVIIPALAKGEVLLNHYGVGVGFDAINIEYTSCSPVNVTTSPDASGEILQVSVELIENDEAIESCDNEITGAKTVYLQGQEAVFHISNSDSVSVEMESVLPIDGRYTTQVAFFGGVSSVMSPAMRGIPRTALNVSLINNAALRALQSRTGKALVTINNKNYTIDLSNIITGMDPRAGGILEALQKQQAAEKRKAESKKNNAKKSKDKKQQDKKTTKNKNTKKDSTKKDSSKNSKNDKGKKDSKSKQK